LSVQRAWAFGLATLAGTWLLLSLASLVIRRPVVGRALLGARLRPGRFTSGCRFFFLLAWLGLPWLLLTGLRLVCLGWTGLRFARLLLSRRLLAGLVLGRRLLGRRLRTRLLLARLLLSGRLLTGLVLARGFLALLLWCRRLLARLLFIGPFFVAWLFRLVLLVLLAMLEDFLHGIAGICFAVDGLAGLFGLLFGRLVLALGVLAGLGSAAAFVGGRLLVRPIGPRLVGRLLLIRLGLFRLRFWLLRQAFRLVLRRLAVLVGLPVFSRLVLLGLFGLW